MRIKFSIQQDYWYFYIVGSGKTGPAHSFPPPKSFDLSIDQLVFWFMLFFHSTKVRIKFSIQQDYWYFYIVGWGKTGPAHSFPPPKSFDLSIDQLVFRFMLLFHSILAFMKDLYQSENQVFNPTRLLVLLHCWVGKDWAGPFFPPSKIF